MATTPLPTCGHDRQARLLSGIAFALLLSMLAILAGLSSPAALAEPGLDPVGDHALCVDPLDADDDASAILRAAPATWRPYTPHHHRTAGPTSGAAIIARAQGPPPVTAHG